MSASTIRKKFTALLRALEKDPEFTVIDHVLGPKPPAARVDAKLAEAGLTVTEETRAYLGEIDRMELAWVRGSFGSPQEAWDAWSASMRDDKARIGKVAGHFKPARIVDLLHPPYRKVPDQVGLKLFDEYDPDSFYPVALDVNPEHGLTVRMGDDYGATFRDGNPITLGGYLELVIATAGQGRNDLLLKHHTAKDRALLDAAGWFEDFDAKATLKLLKGDPETVARWQALVERVPSS